MRLRLWAPQSNSARTPEQTELAYFYAGNNFLLWNRALRDVAAAHPNNIGDNARLLALANLAMADAAITAWDSKKHYVLLATDHGHPGGRQRRQCADGWRPVLATVSQHPDLS